MLFRFRDITDLRAEIQFFHSMHLEFRDGPVLLSQPVAKTLGYLFV